MKTRLSLLILLATLTACVRETTDRPGPATAPAQQGAADSTMVKTSPPPPAPQGEVGAPSTLAPDANESPEALAQYQEARRLIVAGDREQARTVLEKAIAQFPESRHLHQQHAELLWDLSGGTDPVLLKASGQEAAKALEMGLRSGSVDYQLTRRLAETLGRTGDRQTFERLFQQALARDSSAVVQLDYARGLSLFGDARAEEAYRKAVQLEPRGDAVAEYGEWLLDHGRNQEALDVLPAATPLRYVHFLRGVALEKLKRTEEARQEYAQFRDYSATFPAPARFRIAGSQAQAGIQFKEVSGS